MTRNDLEELRALVRLRDDLRRRVERYGRVAVADTVKMSAHDESARVVRSRVRGTTDAGYLPRARGESRRVTAYQVHKRIQATEARINARVLDIEAWLSVQEPDMQLLLRLRYADGLGWAAVGEAAGWSAQRCKDKMTAFWRRAEESAKKQRS